MQFQVETGTRVCTSLDDAGRELVRLRRLAAAAAARLGCRLVASGVAPYTTPGLAALTCQRRYQELARRYGPVVAEAGTCACHVHVGVPALARATLSGYEPAPRAPARCPGPGGGRRTVVPSPQWPQYAPGRGAGHDDAGSRPVAPARRGRAERAVHAIGRMLASLGHLWAELATEAVR
jgi:Glutamate-cysteine ligase family 2(GCS2)